MTRPAPTVAILAALAGAVLFALGTRDPFWSGDFMAEAWPAYMALTDGGLRALMGEAPAYAAFVTLIGAPAALLVEAVQGGVDRTGTGVEAVFRLTALPGVIALAALGALLGTEARRRGASPLGWGLVIALCAGSPLAYKALVYGHPEDLLAAAAAVLGVLAARDGRSTLAGVLLAVAVATKQWAILAVLPAMLAAPRQVLRIGVIAGAGAVVVLLPLMLAAPAEHAPLVTTGALFHPHQVWWPFGVPAPPEFTAAGHGELTSPEWLRSIPHPLIVALALPLSVLWWRRSGGPGRDRDGALALLALLFLERCALDPWNLVYYHLPLTLALLAWEVRQGRRLPLLTLAVTVAAWVSFVTYDARTGYGPFLVYFAWALPLAAHLAHTLYRSRTGRAAAPAD